MLRTTFAAIATCCGLAALAWLAAPSRPGARADTFLGREFTTCDKKNRLAPNCPPPAQTDPFCVKCSNSSGTQAGLGRRDSQGFIVTGEFDCRVKEFGICVDSVCFTLWISLEPCDNIVLVRPQP